MRLDERRKKIAEIVKDNGYISFRKLKEKFDPISEMTLRRDLEYLDQAGEIIRVHGGAKSIDVAIGTDDLLPKRNSRRVEEKKVIAQKAVQLVKTNTVIYLDSGSTLTMMAKVFPDVSCMVFSTGISCIQEMLRLNNVHLNMIGGAVSRDSQSSCSFKSLSYVKNVNFQTAFLGVTGFSLEHGFTCGKEDECELKRQVIENADLKVALMDSSKVGVESTFTYASLKDIDIVVTDENMDSETMDALRDAGITVL